MTKDDVTKPSNKGQTIKAPSPPAFNDRYEAIDVVEESNYKAQLRKAIYMYLTLISSTPRQIEKKMEMQRPGTHHRSKGTRRFQKRATTGF